MRQLSALALGLVGATVACRAVKLRVEAPTVESATLRTQVVKGDPPSPSQCSLPCDLKIRHGSKQQVLIEAPGYYPAQFTFTYDNARVAPEIEDDDEDRRFLRVPLLRRSATPQPSPDESSGATEPPPSDR